MNRDLDVSYLPFNEERHARVQHLVFLGQVAA